MPFANLSTEWRLGIANASLPNAFRWAREVLRLSIQTFPQAFPVYQGHVVHRGDTWLGVAAEQCWDSLADSELGLSNVIRQAAAVDTDWSWRNFTPGIYNNFPPIRLPPKAEFSVSQHSSNLYTQVYYLQNEPDSFYQALGLPNETEACSFDPVLKPRNYTIDQVIDTTGTMPFSSFFEDHSQNSSRKRIKAQALALIFLRIKRIIEAKNRGHTVVPPCPTSAMLGLADPYWGAFYNAVRDGVSILLPNPLPPAYTSQAETGVPPQNLKVLHLHYYSPPRDPVLQGNVKVNKPIEAAAEGAYAVKSGVNWFRQNYSPGQPLDMDVLLSEMGANWQISLLAANDKHKWLWAGGWNNFRDGLSWWNSWLCWLMRRAPLVSELNLANCPNGNKTDAHALYACLHSADLQPYSTRDTSETTPQDGTIWGTTNYGRNQHFFNANSWSTGITTQMEQLVSNYLVPFERFSTSFSSFYPTAWDGGTNFRIGPLGACYKVWSQIATDLLSTTYGTGWYGNSAAGTNIGETTIDLPGGPNGVGVYSTVYFPIIKSMGTFDPNTRFNITWRKSGRPDYSFGYFDPREFPDSKNVTQIWSDLPGPYSDTPYTIPAQPIYSSMIFPVVCYSTSPQTITVRLSRNIGGTEVRLGRPVVLRQACSWLTNQ